jgi:transposase
LSAEEFVYAFSEKLNSEVFAQFIQSLIDQFEKVVLVMDHARYHTSRYMQEFYKAHEHQVHVEWFPSYSPELDPTEQVWRKMKKWLSIRVWTSADELKKQLIVGFESDFLLVPIYDYLLP